MSHLTIALIVLACLLVGVIVGHRQQRLLPQHHLDVDSAMAARQAISLIATMAALVLGLLISSAKGTFDTVNSAVMQNAARVEKLDRALAEYGPETQSIRKMLKRNYELYVEVLASGQQGQLARLSNPAAIRLVDAFQRELATLSPQNPAQLHFQTEALRIGDEVFETYWFSLLQKEGSISTPLLIILVTWLAIIFWSFGLFARSNGTVAAAIVFCAISASAAIFLILELDRPLDGPIRISSVPLREIALLLGQ